MPMAAIAITVFVIAYILIASDRINKTLVALCGAGGNSRPHRSSMPKTRSSPTRPESTGTSSSCCSG